MVAALLVACLACLLLGVLLASTPWLIAAVAVGVVAAALLYHRSRMGAAAPVGPRATGSAPAPVATALVTGTAFAARIRTRAAGPPPAPRSDLRVWVVDGRPGYHLGQCPMLEDAPAGVVPERISLAQALEDGFGPCPTCQPTEERVAAGSAAIVAPPTLGAAEPDDVWVVDGRPRYHRPGCALIPRESAEQIPLEQALEDGFVPCPVCQPDPGRV